MQKSIWNLYFQSIVVIECIETVTELFKIITRIAGEKGMIYIDLFSLYCIDGQLPDELTNDGIHLLPKAYDRWAEAIREYVTSSLK